MLTIKHLLALSISMLFMANAKAQYSFDPNGGCLNVVNVAYAPKHGDYADKCLSVHYQHEFLLNEHFSAGGGLGYSYRTDYKLSAIPLYLSATYFLMDKSFSPFVNLRAGWFGIVGKQNVNNNEVYSVSNRPADFNLFLSPSIGVKMHLADQIGLQLSASYDNYMLNAYDAKRLLYCKRLIGNVAINIGVFFQIPGW